MSEAYVNRRQILTCKVDSRAVGVKVLLPIVGLAFLVQKFE